jgi:RNA polymerase sigma-70 factor (ECF subfamily)
MPGDDAFDATLEQAPHAADLELAKACSRGDSEAIARLEKTYFGELAQALRQIDPSPSFADEVLQRLREKLLVATTEPPRIARYGGNGPLGGWLRVVALREGITMRRERWRDADDDDQLAVLADPGHTPDELVARQRHGEQLRSALHKAIAKQPSRMRALLGFYYADGVGVEELGRLYRVHASTVSRWLAKTREEILGDMRRALAEELRLSATEVDSMLGLARSLEVSIRTLLATR